MIEINYNIKLQLIMIEIRYYVICNRFHLILSSARTKKSIYYSRVITTRNMLQTEICSANRITLRLNRDDKIQRYFI